MPISARAPAKPRSLRASVPAKRHSAEIVPVGFLQLRGLGKHIAE